ncbi:Putative Tyrosinase (melanin production) [Vibrio nigripulchritudo SFn27]|uniref:Putative Tyrosinase (Melanin production) n=1 Tax=Vibrio nigripulchritudo TaxID=28173 RepID=U4K751_9VIBR|nr:tyrosinase family protein [Vibrio nigripulchritudo]CCN80688.1 Putative Tyrosinase (melanin production) [Vibrio nigripulchritudo BLFn1]CCN90030.1 Putative Tyrosinase (melanin production) [Vibrio nigripulchritudo SFn27]CCN93374.1 Putative Tyrosinase (melanin production) [Vibrio nigripulchritudo ENn2]CCO42196.1 Putative Tyrosinase (melanin production) [Vibrio nigripulchritudo SFn135]CCO55269.1 Putative Tyrosinase (melanin production) [Vibrio nigripulchritudo Wn13]
MTTVAKLNYRRKQAGLPLIRFNLLKLNPEDVQDLRDAYAAMYEISELAVGDKRGYSALARAHGYDQDLCHDLDWAFLTWHRSYVYSFEKALNTALKWKREDPDLELTLPYWDWTQFKTSTHASNGLPKLLNELTYTNADGDETDNPLARAKSLYRVISQGLSGDEEFTHRYPDQFRQNIPVLKNEVDRYLTNPSFVRFQADLDRGAHGAIHVFVGGQNSNSPLPANSGDMSRVISASYDPIFWLHHCMVDKIWADWQTLHPHTNIPQIILDHVVYDSRIGSDLIDHEETLRYIYSEDSVETAVADTGTVDTITPKPLSAGVHHVKELSLGSVEAGFVRAQLDFLRLRPPKNSFEIRAYIDNPGCNESTGYDDPSFAGRLMLFGHGQCHGAPGHCNPSLATRDKYDLRSKHALRYVHTRYSMDVTSGLRRYIGRKKSIAHLKIHLLILDCENQVVASDSIQYDGCALRTFAKG